MKVDPNLTIIVEIIFRNAMTLVELCIASNVFKRNHNIDLWKVIKSILHICV